MGKIFFICCSVLLNIAFIFLLWTICKKNKLTFKKSEIITIFGVIFVILLFYIISVATRKFLYYWDYSCYYDLQLGLEDTFANSGIKDGLSSFIGSTWSGEYGTFLTFFPEFIFHFTNRTENAYLICLAVLFIPYLVFAMSIFLKTFLRKIKQDKLSIFISALCIFISMPILHQNLVFGQPDIFGVALITTILALTIDYDFKKLDWQRYAMLIVTTILLVISRRWYLYWVATYYICYAAYLIIHCYLNDKKIA